MITFERLPSVSDRLVHDTYSKSKAHHVNSPPTGFVNPWPSFADHGHGLMKVFQMRFGGSKPPFVPVPANREGLVGIKSPDIALLRGTSEEGKQFRVTWLGHAGFLLQTSWTSRFSSTSLTSVPENRRGINILMDPLFSERTSPVTFAGPRRYTPVPISLADLADAIDIDLVLLSHNHYDHADAAALKYFYHRRQGKIKFLVGLGNSRWLGPTLGLGPDDDDCIIEMDWWDSVMVAVDTNDGSTEGNSHESTRSCVKVICTPSQHTSARSPFDKNQDLWCSFVVEEADPVSSATIPPPGTSNSETAPAEEASSSTVDDKPQVNQSASTPAMTNNDSTSYEHKRLYFAGDTGYMSVPPETGTSPPEHDPTPCPAFRDIAHIFSPIHLSLLPISPCEPRSFVAGVHANPADALGIHRDIGSQRSIAMHWGTVRGGLSAAYEEVTLARREWERLARKAGYRYGWGAKRGNDEDEDWEIGGIDVGETFVL